jgi:hypothetical protein
MNPRRSCGKILGGAVERHGGLARGRFSSSGNKSEKSFALRGLLPPYATQVSVPDSSNRYYRERLC